MVEIYNLNRSHETITSNAWRCGREIWIRPREFRVKFKEVCFNCKRRFQCITGEVCINFYPIIPLDYRIEVPEILRGMDLPFDIYQRYRKRWEVWNANIYETKNKLRVFASPVYEKPKEFFIRAVFKAT